MAKLIAAALILTFLTACGSRSGGGPPEDYILDDPDEGISIYDLDVVRNFESISPAPQYAGSQTQAPITQGNALNLLEAFYTLLDTATESVLTIYDLPYPQLLRYKVPPLPGDEPLCLAGRYEQTVHEEGGRLIIVGDYNNCELIGGGFIHGQQIIDLRLNPAGTIVARSDFTFRNITVRHGSMEAVIHGALRGAEGIKRFIDFTYKDVTQGFTIHANDLVIDIVNQDYIGTFSHSDWGSVLLEKTWDSGNVRMTGFRSSSLTASLRWPGVVLDLALTTPQGTQRRTEVTIAEMFAWPSATDRDPVTLVKAPEVFTRSETVTFTAEYIATAPRGFMTYHWEYLSGPSGCTVNLLPEALKEYTFQADCRGTHHLQLVADNGVQQYIQPFSVQTIGELPDISGVSHQPADAGEAEYWQVLVDNTELDGPFVFRLLNAPEGVDIDDTGRIRGTTPQLISGALGTLHLDVEVSNENAVVQNVSIDLREDAAGVHVYDQSPLGAAIDQAWIDYNGDGHLQNLVDYGQTFAVIQEKEGSVDYTYIEARGFSTGALLARRVMDYDGDGRQDIVLVYPERYLVLDLDDFRVKHNIAFPESLDASSAIRALVIGGNEPAILLGYFRQSAGTGYSAVRYDIPSRTYTPNRYVWDTSETDRRAYHVTDFTGDGYETVYYRTTNHQNPAQGQLFPVAGLPVNFPANVYVVDLVGDGIADLVRAQLPQSADEERTLEVFNPRTGSILDRLPILGAPAFNTDRTDVLTLDLAGFDHPVLVIIEHSTPRRLHLLERQADSYQWLLREPIAFGDSGAPIAVAPFGADSFTVHTGGGIIDGLVIFDGEGKRDALRQEFGRHGQLIPFHADAESGELEVIGFNATIHDTQGFHANRITLGKNAERVSLESHPGFRGAATWDSRPTLLAHHGGTRPRLAYEGMTRVKIVDFETDEVVTDRLRDDINHFHAADLNGDGADELFGLTTELFVQIDTADLSYTTLGERGSNQLPYLPRETLWVEGVGSTPPRLLVPRRPFGQTQSVALEVYQQGGQGIGATEFTLTDPLVNPQYARQDITGDGVPEIIIWGGHFRQDVIVMNANFGVIGRFEVGYGIESVPNIPSHASNRLIFTHSEGVPEGHTRIAEYDPVTRKVVSESQVFPGILQRDGFICMGDDLYTCDKFLVFEQAVYHVQGNPTQEVAYPPPSL